MKPTVQERFWSKVNKTGECWLWTGARTRSKHQRYASFTFDGRTMGAHRFAYELLVGPIPDGMRLDHRATCPKHCVNPAHLRPVTYKQDAENQAGAYRNSSTGERGVFKRGERYRVAVRHNGILHWFGTYDTLEEAREVARQKRIELFTHNDADRHTNLVSS